MQLFFLSYSHHTGQQNSSSTSAFYEDIHKSASSRHIFSSSSYFIHAYIFGIIAFNIS